MGMAIDRERFEEEEYHRIVERPVTLLRGRFRPWYAGDVLDSQSVGGRGGGFRKRLLARAAGAAAPD